MLDTYVADSAKAAQLSGAILLYGGGANNGEKIGFATVHQVETINQRPEIMPGRPMMEADLVIIAKSVAAAKSAVTTNWFEPSLLARGPDRMIWWSPPGNRPVFFKKSDLVKNTFDGKGVCPIPGLVWMAMPDSGLYVYAVKGGERPRPETQLYQAPLFNVWGRGKVCVGNADLPGDGEVNDQAAWEKVVFGSHFTHPNFPQPNRLIKGMKPATFWQAMLTDPPAAFPETRLVQVPLKVSDLLERDVLDTLAKLPKPKGEF